MNRTSQKLRMVRYMETHGCITSFDATTVLHIMSPTKRISELIRDGYGISKERVNYTDNDGFSNHYNKYSIIYYPNERTLTE